MQRFKNDSQPLISPRRLPICSQPGGGVSLSACVSLGPNLSRPTPSPPGINSWILALNIWYLDPPTFSKMTPRSKCPSWFFSSVVLYHLLRFSVLRNLAKSSPPSSFWQLRSFLAHISNNSNHFLSTYSVSRNNVYTHLFLPQNSYK